MNYFELVYKSVKDKKRLSEKAALLFCFCSKKSLVCS